MPRHEDGPGRAFDGSAEAAGATEAAQATEAARAAERSDLQDAIPGREAERPGEIPLRGWKQILRRAWKESKDDHVSLMAGGVAFAGFLALFPALIGAVLLYGLVADPAEVKGQLHELAAVLPDAAQDLLEAQMRDLAGGSQAAQGIGLVVTLSAALWAASGGIVGLMEAINIAYDEKETRNVVRKRGLALGLTIAAILFLVIAVGLIAVLPVCLDSIGLGGVGRVLAGIAEWVGLVVAMMVALALLYQIAPSRNAPKLRWVSLGAIVATATWIVASAGFSVYVDNFSKYGKTYGTLAGVVVLMLWLYLTAYVVLLGAEINAESEQQTVRDTTMGPARPRGRRGAVKADNLPEDSPYLPEA